MSSQVKFIFASRRLESIMKAEFYLFRGVDINSNAQGHIMRKKLSRTAMLPMDILIPGPH